MIEAAIYIHDGVLHRVVEELADGRILMEVDLPDLDRNEEQFPKLLVFEDVVAHEVHEGWIVGTQTLLDFTLLGNQGERTKIRLDSTYGYREITCRTVKVLDRDAGR